MKHFALVLLALLFTSCATPPTADQLTAYSIIGHQALVDWKTIKRIESTP